MGTSTKGVVERRGRWWQRLREKKEIERIGAEREKKKTNWCGGGRKCLRVKTFPIFDRISSRLIPSNIG